MQVLIINKHYLPGYRAGGPIRSLSAMVERVSGMGWRVVARDRDFGDSDPYPGVQPGKWQRVGNADVMYVLPGWRGLRDIRKALEESASAVVYLNSVFSVLYSTAPLLMLRFLRAPRRPVVLAPRGEFSIGALRLGSGRKRLFLNTAKALGLFRGVRWHATSVEEITDIRREIGDDVDVLLAPNISMVAQADREGLPKRTTEKRPGELRIAFLSRVTAKKNLAFALSCCRELKGRIHFDILGAVTDLPYRAECEAVIETLPANVTVEWHGSIVHEEVIGRLVGSDLFFLPTLGENFGHVIAEAVTAGLPLLLSDQTPWRGLADAGVGWDLPLDDPQAFQTVLQKMVDMDGPTWSELSDRVVDYSRSLAVGSDVDEAYVRLFTWEGIASPVRTPGSRPAPVRIES